MTPGTSRLAPSLALPLPAHEGFGKPAQNERYECYKVAAGARDPVRYHEPMATVEHPTDTLISLTPVAAAKIRELMAEEDDAATLVLRVAIQGGGCSGFQYGLGFDAGAAEGDVELDARGHPGRRRPLQRAVPARTTIDFLNTISESGFKIDNPNAVSSCGCGHSFQVEEGEELPEGTARGRLRRRL